MVSKNRLPPIKANNWFKIIIIIERAIPIDVGILNLFFSIFSKILPILKNLIFFNFPFEMRVFKACSRFLLIFI